MTTSIDESSSAAAPSSPSVERPAGPFERLWRRGSSWLLVPLGVLFAAITVLGSSTDSDEGAYIAYARNLAEGSYTSSNDPDLWFGPGLPLLVAPLAALDAPLELVRVAGGAVPLFLAMVVFLRLLRLYVPPEHALAGTYALGLFFPLYTLLPTLHSEPLALLLVVVASYSLALYARRGAAQYLVVAGLALAWLAVTRVIFGYVVTVLLFAFLLWALVRRNEIFPRRLVATHALALALCAPWLVYTYSLTDRAFHWGNSGGLSLYWMTSPYAGDQGDWHSTDDVFREEYLAPHRPLFASLRDRDQSGLDEGLREEALNNIADDPGRYVLNVGRNLSRMLFNFPYTATRQKLSTAFYAFPNAVLIGLLTFCVAVLFLKRQRMPREAVPFLALLGVTFGAHTLLSAYPRMLWPVLPLVIWLIVYTMSRHVQLVRVKLGGDRR